MTIAGAIHLIVEGYFVYFNRTMPERVDWLGQAWKEYALSDSRYMFSDPSVLAIEGLAAVSSQKHTSTPLDISAC